MSTGSVNLGDFLAGLKDQFGENLEGAQGGSAWSGPPIDCTREYRVSVIESSFGNSNAGNPQITVVFEIQDDEEFAGRRGREYFKIDDPNEWGRKKFSQFILNTGVSLENAGADWDAFAKQFEGATVVAALRNWGDELENYSFRYTNPDKGQALKTGLKLKENKPSLVPQVSVQKGEPFPDKPATQTPLPSVASVPSGVRLPPGLGKQS